MLRQHGAFRAGILLLALVMLASHTPVAFGQNPVQWSGDVRGSVGRAAEQSMPLLFWVSQGRDPGDDDDLRDMQSECFRDPTVVGMVHKYFVPVRVSRTSNVIAEAEKLGLPTQHALYCAVLTHDGRLLDQMGPGEVADARVFAEHLNRALETFRDDLYTKEILPILQDPKATLPKLRLALQTVWRLDIRKADVEVVRLLDREGLTLTQKSRLYELLGALGTAATTAALLDRSEEKPAAAALGRASVCALEWLLPEMPVEGAGGVGGNEVTARQVTAYQASVQICRMMNMKSKEWWEKAKPEDRRKELERVRERAASVLEFEGNGGR